MDNNEQKAIESLNLLETEKPEASVKGTSKLNNAMAFLMLFKSCVGLGVFSYPFAFSKVGYIWGSVLSMVICYVTTYGMYIMTDISNKIELETNFNETFYDFHRICEYVAVKAYGPKFGTMFSSFSNLITLLMNGSLITASIVNITNQTISLLGLSKIQIKLLILLIYMGISAYAILPQQLKVFSFISAVVSIFVLSSMFYDNIDALVFSIYPQNIDINYQASNLGGTGLFLSMAGFAYEAIGTVFSIRKAMANPHSLASMIKYGFPMIGVMYTVYSLSFYFVYGKDNILPFTLLFYPKDLRPLFYAFGLVFCFALLLFIPLNNISNSEILQDRSFIKALLQDASGQPSAIRLILFRWLLLLLATLPALITDKVELVLGVTGSLVVPMISLLIPLAVKYMFDKCRDNKSSVAWMIHDCLVAVLGLLVFVFGLLSAIQGIREAK